MKTLLERAKPGLLAAMELHKVNHPNIVERSEKWLSENYFVSDMTWWIWEDIKSCWTITANLFPDNPWPLFEDIKLSDDKD